MTTQATRADCPRCRRSRSVRPLPRDPSRFRCLRCNHVFGGEPTTPPPAAGPLVDVPLGPASAAAHAARAEPIAVSYEPDVPPNEPNRTGSLSPNEANPAVPRSPNEPNAPANCRPARPAALINLAASAALILSHLTFVAGWLPGLALFRLPLGLASLGLAAWAARTAWLDHHPAFPVAAASLGLCTLAVGLSAWWAF